jgi:hypothetical protein
MLPLIVVGKPFVGPACPCARHHRISHSSHLHVPPRLCDARQAQAAVPVLRELLEQLLIFCLCCFEVSAGLLDASQVVPQSDLRQEEGSARSQLAGGGPR